MHRGCLPLSISVALAVATAAGAAGSPRDERVRLTPADTALARRAVLRRSDLPAGWTRLPPNAGDESIRCRGYDPDLSRFTVTGRARSAFFAEGTGASVGSSVQVFPSAAQASADFRTATRSALMACVSARFLRELRQVGSVGVRVASQRMSTTPRVGAESATYRFVFELPVGRATVRLHLSLVTFRAGRAIGVVSLGTLRNPPTSERALARRMAARLT